MNKLFLSATVISALLFLNSCGDASKDEKTEKENTEETTDEEVEEEMIECSPSMMDFMAMLKGSYTDVEAALDQFGVEGLNRADMDLYDLKDANVVACNKLEKGECCTMEAPSGASIRTYDICWTDGKITSVIDKGMR